MSDPWIGRYKEEAVPFIFKFFKAQKILLFGSRVRGTANKNSDIDVIIISSYFEGIPFIKRMALVLKKVSFPKHVDYICYTPKEYERMKEESSLVMDALEKSIEISIEQYL